MCAGVEATVVSVSGDTVEVDSRSGQRTLLWTAAEPPRVGDRVLTFAGLGLGVVPHEAEPETKPLEEAL
jgi:hydrogenase maturation factor